MNVTWCLVISHLVESILLKHPDIKAVAVTSVPDDIRGEEVFACIVPDTADAQAIMDYSLDQTADYKAPGYIHFVTELPLTGTQKVQRGVLKTLAAELLQHPETHHTAPLKKRQTS